MFASLYATRLFILLAIISMVASAPIPIRRSIRPIIIRDDTSSDSGSDSGSNPDSDSGSSFDSDSGSSSTDNTSVDSDSGSGNSTSTDGVAFAADSSIDVAAILQSVKSATSNPVSGANFGTGHDNNKAQIYQLNVDSSAGGSVYAVEADMDVDCDGTDYQCQGNTDGQSETSYGALSAKRVPFYVLPQSFVDKQNIKGNSLGAIICNNRMFYAIMGDTNGDSPEVIGEASWLMARTCFPSDDLNGAKGHDQSDVMYIVFGALVPSGIDEDSPTIDVSALKELGDKTLKAFKVSN
ncbi:putative chitosanase [Lentinula raphanica]|nr:putative chitosanase [Lentinula raphanica]